MIGRENAKRTDVHRKNGIIVNEGRAFSRASMKRRQHDGGGSEAEETI